MLYISRCSNILVGLAIFYPVETNGNIMGMYGIIGRNGRRMMSLYALYRGMSVNKYDLFGIVYPEWVKRV